jgi:hypothetical protein
MSDRALLSTLEEIHTTRQRRARWPAWRRTPVSISARVALAAVLMVAVGLLAIDLVPRQPDRAIVGGPWSSPSAHVPDLTTTFVSPRNGFSIKHADEVLITPTRHPGETEDHWTDLGVDVVETDHDGMFMGVSSAIPDEEEHSLVDWASIDEWVDEWVALRSCGVPLSQQAEITIDGASGRIAKCPGEIVATVVAGGRLYRFTMLHEPGDASAAFDAFVATIDLTPETAIDYPALKNTFVSPTYGYSFSYFDRGGLSPATTPWDPVTQQGDHSDDRFDTVQTGMSAYFKSASAPIPEGVLIDDWVDEFITPAAAGGCHRPRSLQAEITIDERSGRVAECENGIHATVVAGGRLYLFTLLHGRRDARAWFDAWIDTIDLTPETVAVPSST